MKRFIPFAALIALTLVFFYRLALTPLILGRGDTFTYFYPYWQARDAAFAAGRLPLWTPNVFMGAPLLANSQIGTFYPPNWITWLLTDTTPDSVRVSVLLHIAWAAVGAYLLARRSTGLSRFASVIAAAIFAFGGTIGAHVEQINQLQGLSWMPFIFLCIGQIGRGRGRRWIPALAACIALQFFTGHTQTVFITLIGAGVLTLMQPGRLRRLIGVASAGLIALVLTAPQLIPTLELTGLSNRQGGLTPNEATAFSFNPFVAGRGLLPNYDSTGALFGEYIAYIGVIGMALLVVGMIAPSKKRLMWILLAGVGLFFAFGVYNPFYWILAGLPGFNLFRVPARWLALFALGAAMIAGFGVDRLRSRNVSWATIAAFFALIGGLGVSAMLADRNPDGTPASIPDTITLIGWAVAAIFGGLMLALRGGNPARTRFLLPLIGAALIVELFIASHTLPHNDLTAQEVWNAERFTISQMQVNTGDDLDDLRDGYTPPGRMLSISNIYFDPGDRAALETRYRAMGLSDTAIRYALVAVKLKDVLAPNLPLAWDIPSIDGYDGGVLPTAWYSTFMRLMQPEGDSVGISDGRLRERLALEACFGACIPEQRWLDLTGTQFLITDKVFDLWYADVAYDTQFATRLYLNSQAFFNNATGFYADAVDVAYLGAITDVPPVVVGAGEPLSEPILIGTLAGRDILRVRYALSGEMNLPPYIEVNADSSLIDGFIQVHAVTLVDIVTGDFQQLAPEPWLRTLSSDIKIYENITPMPRAFVVQNAIVVEDSPAGDEQALDIMRGIQPEIYAVVAGEGAAAIEGEIQTASLQFTEYTPERVAMRVYTGGGYLVLTDAYYPGWIATINGEAVPILRADVMFRAIRVPEGRDLEVVFTYRPAWLIPSLVIGGVGWLIVIGMRMWMIRRYTVQISHMKRS